jgi:hypothetical protein
MAKEQFLTFKKFNDEIAVIELGILFKDNNLEFIIEDTSASFDPSFANSELSKEWRMKLRKQDFETAEVLLQQLFSSQLDAIDKDYYLFNFTDPELMEVLSMRDEWGQFDFLLAQKLLKERGKEVNAEMLEVMRGQRIEKLAKPEESQKTYIYAGYIMALLGGLLGLFIGWHLLAHKKTLPNGDLAYSYSPADRKDGYRIVIIAVICFVVWTVLWASKFSF